MMVEFTTVEELSNLGMEFGVPPVVVTGVCAFAAATRSKPIRQPASFEINILRVVMFTNASLRFLLDIRRKPYPYLFGTRCSHLNMTKGRIPFHETNFAANYG
jgi:hypothetical protein